MSKRAIFILLALLASSLTGCGSTNEPKAIDLEGELKTRPQLSLNSSDGTILYEGMEGSYCTASVCFDGPLPDFAGLEYTPYLKGDLLILSIGTEDSVEGVSGSLYKTDGTEFMRDLSFAPSENSEGESGIYQYTVSLPETLDEDRVVLHVKLNLFSTGRGHYYFPLDLEPNTFQQK